MPSVSIHSTSLICILYSFFILQTIARQQKKTTEIIPFSEKCLLMGNSSEREKIARTNERGKFIVTFTKNEYTVHTNGIIFLLFHSLNDNAFSALVSLNILYVDKRKIEK